MILNRILGGIIVVLLAAFVVQTFRLHSKEKYIAAYEQRAYDNTLKIATDLNKQKAATEAALKEQDIEYQKGKQDAEQLYTVTIANLRGDNKRMQKHWRDAIKLLDEAKAASADSGGDGEAEALRADLAAFVRDARSCDAKIVRLQDRIDSYLIQINGQGWYDN